MRTLVLWAFTCLLSADVLGGEGTILEYRYRKGEEFAYEQEYDREQKWPKSWKKTRVTLFFACRIAEWDGDKGVMEMTLERIQIKVLASNSKDNVDFDSKREAEPKKATSHGKALLFLNKTIRFHLDKRGRASRVSGPQEIGEKWVEETRKKYGDKLTTDVIVMGVKESFKNPYYVSWMNLFSFHGPARPVEKREEWKEAKSCTVFHFGERLFLPEEKRIETTSRLESVGKSHAKISIEGALRQNGMVKIADGKVRGSCQFDHEAGCLKSLELEFTYKLSGATTTLVREKVKRERKPKTE